VDASKIDNGVLAGSDFVTELLKRVRGSIENLSKKVKKVRKSQNSKNLH